MKPEQTQQLDKTKQRQEQLAQARLRAAAAARRAGELLRRLGMALKRLGLAIARWRPSEAQKDKARWVRDSIAVTFQRMLPTLWLSSMMHRIARIENKTFKDMFIGSFLKLYKVNLLEAEFERYTNYPTFNAFFTRALKPNARLLDPDPKMLISPVDGRISQVGPIRNWSLLQAKGQDFTVEELIGSHASARAFHNGSFCTIYLAPHNYHRIHMPANGKLKEWSYHPGKLFSVSAKNVDRMPKLFAQNERICAIFDTDFGPLAVVMVGALFVGGIQTVWAGQVTPPHGQKEGIYAPMSPVILLRGRELGRFNMGSTVILLAPPRMVAWRPHLEPGREVRMGLSLGALTRVK